MSSSDEKLQAQLLLISDKPLDVDSELADVLDAVMPVASRWKEFGVRLRIRSSKLDDIDKNDQSDPKQCLIDVLTEWLRRNYDTAKFGQPTWRLLAKAVHPIHGALFQQIAEKHKEVVSSPCPVASTVVVSTPVASTVGVMDHMSPPKDPPPTEEPTHPALFERPTAFLLQLIKYKDATGRPHSVRPEQTLAFKWREMGTRFEFEESKLKIWTTQYNNDLERAHAVLGHWLRNGSDHYPCTWEGFLTMCEDIELRLEAGNIRKAVIANYESKR